MCWLHKCIYSVWPVRVKKNKHNWLEHSLLCRACEEEQATEIAPKHEIAFCSWHAQTFFFHKWDYYMNNKVDRADFLCAYIISINLLSKDNLWDWTCKCQIWGHYLHNDSTKRQYQAYSQVWFKFLNMLKTFWRVSIRYALVDSKNVVVFS